MSTRAVYTFKGSEAKGIPRAAIYIHSDGYLEGAATYFLAMLHVEAGSHYRQRGGLATRFLVANREHAELTTKASDHSDIEFHYIVEPFDTDAQLFGGKGAESAKMKAYEVNWRDSQELVFSGTIGEFVGKYANPRWLPERYQSDEVKELVTSEE